MVYNTNSLAARIRLCWEEREDRHRHAILLGEGMPTTETDQEQRVLGTGLFHRLHAFTKTGSTHSGHGTFRHILCSDLHFIYFLCNTSSPKHVSCHVMFSLSLFPLPPHWLISFNLILGIFLINGLREKKLNLPGVSVVLIEL